MRESELLGTINSFIGSYHIRFFKRKKKVLNLALSICNHQAFKIQQYICMLFASRQFLRCI